MSSLRLGDGFTLPVDAMTGKLAILAQSGAGKTNTAVVLVEEILDAKQQVIVLDPKGDWWGLKSSADGKSEGYPVTVFGGLHGDLPIFPESGATIARLLVEEGISAVIDVSDFETDGQRHRFTTDFALAFYKAKQRNKSPVLFILEEADESCPQQMVEATEARMIGAIKRIAKLGRFCGIGFLLVSQRAADVNKKVLSQAGIIVAMRTWHETDLKAIAASLKQQIPKALFDEVMAALPSLDVGEGFVVSPGLGIKRRVKFRLRRTFDAGETPKVGQVRREPKVLAPVRLEALREQLAAEVERAKADDPAELRKQLKAAQAELSKAKATPAIRVEERVIEKAVPFVPEEIKAFLAHVADTAPGLAKLAASGPGVLAVAGRMPPAPPVQPSKVPPPGIVVKSGAPRPVKAIRRGSPAPASGDLSRPQQAILDGLAFFESVGIHEPTRAQVALSAEVSHNSGGFRANVSTLSGKSLLHYPTEGCLALTEDGRAIARAPETPPTEEALQESLMNRVSGPQAAILRELLRVHPDDLPRDQLAEAVGVAATSGGFRANVSTLSGLGLVTYPTEGRVKASPALFLAEATA